MAHEQQDLLDREVMQPGKRLVLLRLTVLQAEDKQFGLVVDGITGRETFVPDLLKDIVAFQVQYGARVIIGSQNEFDLSGWFAAHQVHLAPLKPEHKRAIYSFHAGITDTSDLGPFCEAFGTAFDLMIAVLRVLLQPSR